MGVLWVMFRSNSGKPGLEIVTSGGISILSNQEACTGVKNENRADPLANLRIGHDLSDDPGDFQEALPGGRNHDGFGVHHRFSTSFRSR